MGGGEEVDGLKERDRDVKDVSRGRSEGLLSGESGSSGAAFFCNAAIKF